MLPNVSLKKKNVYDNVNNLATLKRKWIQTIFRSFEDRLSEMLRGKTSKSAGKLAKRTQHEETVKLSRTSEKIAHRLMQN